MLPSQVTAFSSVERIIQDHRQIFQRLGLSFEKSYVENRANLNPALWNKFTELASSYEITIAFSIIPAGKGAGLNAFIVRPDGTNIAIKRYLEVHNFLEQRALFDCSADVIDFDEYVEVFVTNLEQLLAGELKPFIEGSKWESVSFDWGPYK